MITHLFMDVDGTLTDGRIYLDAAGGETKAFDVKDGYAISRMLPSLGIVPVVITGRTSAIVDRRFGELGVEHIWQGVSDKLSVMQSFLDREGVKLCSVGYIGDDLNDLACMEAISAAGGIVACPSDAADAVKEISGIVCGRPGGRGAVRALVDAFARTR